jgi:tetratricopeptide (TPR) repeat protein
MQSKFYLIIIIAVIVGFFGGFFVANRLNRAEIDELNKKLVEKQPAKTGSTSGAATELSEEEIDKSIAQAKERPDDFNFHKRLGLALYTYAASKSNEERLDDVERLLNRAFELKSDDFEVIVSLANLNFDLGRLRKDNKRFISSREYYKKALEKRPGDIRILADFAVTYLDSTPPDSTKAIELLNRAYVIDKKNETVLFYLIRAYIADKQMEKARKSLVELKEVNPANAAVKEFEAIMKKETGE